MQYMSIAVVDVNEDDFISLVLPDSPEVNQLSAVIHAISAPLGKHRHGYSFKIRNLQSDVVTVRFTFLHGYSYDYHLFVNGQHFHPRIYDRSLLLAARDRILVDLHSPFRKARFAILFTG